MNALAEPIVWVIRVGHDHCRFGDCWEFCVTATYNGNTAWLHAGQGRMTRDIWAAVGQELRRLGFTHAAWERVNADGSFRRIERKISES